MYALLLYSSWNPAFLSEYLWGFAFINLLAAGLTLWRPDTGRLIALLAVTDFCLSLALVGFELHREWNIFGSISGDWHATRAVLALAGLALALWVYSGNLWFDKLLPVRGRWAARLMGAAALGMIQFASLTDYTRQTLMWESPHGQPPGLFAAALVATLTLPGYYVALWKLIVEGRS